MEIWYKDYYAQAWYRNTYLVHHPNQIARADKKQREWNNLSNSGCHFTCLAMIIGIDPARLASELGSQHPKFFLPDKEVPATRLNGKKGGLVWDQNAPNSVSPLQKLEKVWHPIYQRKTNIKIEFIKIIEMDNEADAVVEVTKFHDRGYHIICGPNHHSCLIAGKNGKDLIVWDPDPDETKTSVEKIIKGHVTLKSLFEKDKTKSDKTKTVINFWVYRMNIS